MFIQRVDRRGALERHERHDVHGPEARVHPLVVPQVDPGHRHGRDAPGGLDPQVGTQVGVGGCVTREPDRPRLAIIAYFARAEVSASGAGSSNQSKNTSTDAPSSSTGFSTFGRRRTLTRSTPGLVKRNRVIPSPGSSV